MSALEFIGLIALWAISGVAAFYAAIILTLIIDEWLHPHSGLGGLILPMYAGCAMIIVWIIWGAMWVGWMVLP